MELCASSARVIACVSLTVALASATPGATRFVAPEPPPGGDGSREKPLRLRDVLKKGALGPGDEVVLLDGVYRGTFAIASTGSEKGPVVYRAEHRHKAVLDGGTPLAGWKKLAGQEGTWECFAETAPERLLVNGEGIIPASSRWRRDGKRSLARGMFVCEKVDKSAFALDEVPGTFVVRFRPWAGEAPREVFAVSGTVLAVGGAYNVVDGLLIRRGVVGVHLKGDAVHTYKHEAGTYRDLSGLAHNAYGCYNIVRRCIIRDMVGCGMTSNESRFNLIEDNVVYNAGMGQGDHGIYISQGAENLTLRRNIWWRTSGGAIHIYSGSGIDSPRHVVVEHNIFGPDKRSRCFPITNRKSCALYVWGGSRWAGCNRIVHNIVVGPHDRAISLHRCNFNLIAHNTLLGSDGAAIQVGSGFGNVIANNIIEHAPGGQEPGCQPHPVGSILVHDDDHGPPLSVCRNNLILPRAGKKPEVPAWMRDSKAAAGDPFVDRARFDFRLKPDAEAIDMAAAIPHLVPKPEGKAPDAGAVELGQALSGEGSQFPPIPRWLLEEWPLAKRGQ